MPALCRDLLLPAVPQRRDVAASAGEQDLGSELAPAEGEGLVLHELFALVVRAHPGEQLLAVSLAEERVAVDVGRAFDEDDDGRRAFSIAAMISCCSNIESSGGMKLTSCVGVRRLSW